MCGEISSCMNIRVNRNNKFFSSIYPNPASDVLHVEIEKNTNIMEQKLQMQSN